MTLKIHRSTHGDIVVFSLSGRIQVGWVAELRSLHQIRNSRFLDRAGSSKGRPRLCWLTNAGTSSARLYWENNTNNFDVVDSSIPAPVTVFPGQIYRAPPS